MHLPPFCRPIASSDQPPSSCKAPTGASFCRHWRGKGAGPPHPITARSRGSSERHQKMRTDRGPDNTYHPSPPLMTENTWTSVHRAAQRRQTLPASVDDSEWRRRQTPPVTPCLAPRAAGLPQARSHRRSSKEERRPQASVAGHRESQPSRLYPIQFAAVSSDPCLVRRRVQRDVTAEGLGVKGLLPPYLDPHLQDSELPTDVCFASAGSGLDDIRARIQSIQTITDQLYRFKEYISRLRNVVGEQKANYIISMAVFLISSGNNDLLITYYGLHLRPLFGINAYTSQLVTRASKLVKDLYNLGARKIAFMSTVPLGCLPVVGTVFGRSHQELCTVWPTICRVIAATRIHWR
ncbi:hypothetical protein Tsubulata_047180 [Turnera subulata]|uniref:GDSL esterase/lipase n=1 Tax=Turnera subulata TaxID=218843 RepID=A0A9Q0G459_9ROSI|nr:hypothetical protein Tsubulata_047180 [Turnera subulata]